jgi:hypothetical protein
MRTAVLLLLMLTVAGGCGDEGAPEPPIDVAAKAAQRGALLSIYHHGYPGRFDPALFDPPVIPLDAVAAARVLIAAEGEAARYRVREAIAVLAAGTYDDGGYSREIDAALRVLGAPVDAIAARFADASLANRSQRELAVYEVLAASGLGAACAQSTTDVAFDTVTQSTVAAITVTGLQRDFSEVARIFDPQNWDQCNDFFAASYVAKKVGTAYPRDASGTAEVALSPPAAGTTWSDVLYEEFDFTPANYPGWIKNLFDIHAHRTSTLFQYEYTLHESINTKLDGWPLIPKGLERNQGYVAASVLVDGSVRITGVKVLQYDATLAHLNAAAQWFLRPMGEQARTMACTCELPARPRPWWWFLAMALDWVLSLFE